MNIINIQILRPSESIKQLCDFKPKEGFIHNNNLYMVIPTDAGLSKYNDKVHVINLNTGDATWLDKDIYGEVIEIHILGKIKYDD